MERLNIVFMGTPQFAVPSLKILIENEYHVVAVVTAPDKPKGRGRQVISSPIKECAIKHGIPVLQPVNLKSPEFVQELKSFGANLQIVVAFRMLPEIVWSMPAIGTFNLHASVLPKYRGAAPIHWAIINGEKETGVTTFFLKHEIDTGNIIHQESEAILSNDTTGSLSDRLMIRGARLVLKTVRSIEVGDYQLTPQKYNNSLPKAPKLFKSDCEIPWKKTAGKIVDFVRGLNPFPTAWTEINGIVYKIYSVEIVAHNKSSDERDYHTDGSSFLHFNANDGVVSIKEIQAPGKRRMSIQEFLRGNKL